VDQIRGGFSDAAGIRTKLAASDPGNAGWQRDLIVSNVKLAEISAANGRLPKAAEHYRAALTTAEVLAANGRLAPPTLG
jgi:hypothetical protein